MTTLKTQQTNNLTNTQVNKQTNTFTNTRIGVIRGVITPPRSNQLIEPPCSRTFCYSVWCYTTANHQLKLPQPDFGNLYSISYVKMFIHSCGHAKQWALTTTIAVASLPYKVTQLGLYVRSLHIKTRTDFQAPLQNKINTNWGYM